MSQQRQSAETEVKVSISDDVDESDDPNDSNESFQASSKTSSEAATRPTALADVGTTLTVTNPNADDFQLHLTWHLHPHRRGGFPEQIPASLHALGCDTMWQRSMVRLGRAASCTADVGIQSRGCNERIVWPSTFMLLLGGALFIAGLALSRSNSSDDPLVFLPLVIVGAVFAILGFLACGCNECFDCMPYCRRQRPSQEILDPVIHQIEVEWNTWASKRAPTYRFRWSYKVERRLYVEVCMFRKFNASDEEPAHVRTKEAIVLRQPEPPPTPTSPSPYSNDDDFDDDYDTD